MDASGLVIYFWGLSALVTGGAESAMHANVLLLNMQATNVEYKHRHPHIPQLMINARNVEWRWDPKGEDKGKCQKLPDRLVPMGEDIYAVWNLAGLTLAIEGAVPNRLTRATKVKATSADPGVPIDALGSTKGVGQDGSILDNPEKYATVDPQYLGQPSADGLVAAKVVLTDGVIDAIKVREAFYWQFALSKPDGTPERNRTDPQELPPAARYRYPKQMKTYRLCFSEQCNESIRVKGAIGPYFADDDYTGSRVGNLIPITISNYPTVDSPGAGLQHFKAYYELLATPPPADQRPIPFCVAGGRVAAVPPTHQDVPHCQMAVMREAARMPETKTRSVAPCSDQSVENPDECAIVIMESPRMSSHGHH